jgi:DNA-binding transcriptional LysR family regulator
MNVTLKQLHAFIAVAETNSFSRAAEKMLLAQSAVSVLIRDLEETLATRLLDRTTRRVELTLAGREFRVHVEKILSDLEHALLDTHLLGEGKRGRLTIAAPPLLTEALIPRILVPFKREFPNVPVVMIDGRTERIVEAVRSGEADIGLGTFVRDPEGLVRTPLIREELLLFCPQGHSLAKIAQVKWRDIKKIPQIMLTGESAVRHLVDFGCTSAGISVQPEYEVALVSTALALVDAGFGVTVLPTSSASAIRGRRVVTRPLSYPTVSRQIDLISRHGRSLSPVAAEWVQRLRSELKASLQSTLRR